MTNDRPNINALSSYGVTKAAELLGISRQTLRRYEAAGLVPMRLNKMGQRRYSGAVLLKLWQMYY